MYKEQIVGKTKTGKALAYRVKDGDPLYSIYFVGGGQLPSCLAGMWNDTRQIEAAITSYINKDKLCEPDQKEKDLKDNLKESKKRPSKLKLRKQDAA